MVGRDARRELGAARRVDAAHARAEPLRAGPRRGDVGTVLGRGGAAPVHPRRPPRVRRSRRSPSASATTSTSCRSSSRPPGRRSARRWTTTWAKPILELLGDVTPLVRRARARGTTLIHGDLRDENIALAGRAARAARLRASRRRATPRWSSPGTWSTTSGGSRRPTTRSSRTSAARSASATIRVGARARPDLGLVQYGWIFGHSAVVHTDPAERQWARTELNWWVPRVRHALEQWR